MDGWMDGMILGEGDAAVLSEIEFVWNQFRHGKTVWLSRAARTVFLGRLVLSEPHL